MAIVAYLIGSGLFKYMKLHEDGAERLQVVCYPYASVYVHEREHIVHIRTGAFRNFRFPNNERLHEFVRIHAAPELYGEGNAKEAYELGGHHVAKVVEIIREGIEGERHVAIQ